MSHDSDGEPANAGAASLVFAGVADRSKQIDGHSIYGAKRQGGGVVQDTRLWHQRLFDAVDLRSRHGQSTGAQTRAGLGVRAHPFEFGGAFGFGFRLTKHETRILPDFHVGSDGFELGLGFDYHP